MTKPILSIVIANYNYGRFLEDAIKSVIAQGVGDKIELIICDAASIDNSVEVIKKYACGLPPNTTYDEWVSKSDLRRAANDTQLLTWWCSEKDSGQSEAFNKGFSHARGDWLTWLNADELYADGCLAAFLRLIGRRKGAKWITGNMASFDECDKKIKFVTWGPHTSAWFFSAKHYPYAVFGPTSFWRRDVYDKVGPIDEKLRYAMDIDYWERLAIAGYKQTRLNHYCWLFRKHSDSKTAGAQTDVSLAARRAEKAYHTKKNAHQYVFSVKNPWYVLWVVWRCLDGSMFVRWYKHRKLLGKPISILSEVAK